MNQRVSNLLFLAIFNLLCVHSIGQTTLYSEDFTGQNGKGAIGTGTSIFIDTSGVDWAIDTSEVNFQDASDYVQVVSEKIEFRDTEGNAKWISPGITVTNLTTLTLSIDLSEVGTMEASDSLKIYYKIDNGSETEVRFISDDFTSISLTDTALVGTGNTLYIIVYGNNGADTEKHRIDNLLVKGTCGGTPSESSDFMATSNLNSASLSWTAPTCSDEVLIVAKLSSTISGTPSGDGTSYTADANFSGSGTAFDGGKVVYKGSGTAVSVTNLTSTSNYYYKIWSRTGTNWTTGVEISASTLYVPKLIISEVADPSDNTGARFAELFNADTVSIDFSATDYYLCKETNGGGSFSCSQITGTLSPGGTYVVANNSSSFNTQYSQSPSGTFSNTSGNGDDGYFLYIGGDNSSGTLLDAYGVIGQDGTSQTWEYEDSRAFRNTTISDPNSTWTAAEWTIVSATASACYPFIHTSTFPKANFSANASLIGGTYGSVTINGSSISVTASSEVTIQNSLSMTDGLLNLNGNNLSLGTESSDCTVSGGSSSSYVYGGTIKSFVNSSTGTFSFPMGSSSSEYSPVSVNFTSSTLAAGAYLETTISGAKHPNFDQHVTSYIDRNWTVEATGITNSNYAIQLDYVDADVVGNESAILPVKYSGGSWTSPGTIGNDNVDTVGVGTINTGSNFLSWTGVTSFSIFGGAGGGAPLPVDLIAFSGKHVDTEVHLKWKTASELNNDYFLIERVLENGSSIGIGTIAGNGTSNEAHVYEIIDYHPNSGINYYRLNQFDFNGTLNTHEIIAVESKKLDAENSPTLFFDNTNNELTINNLNLTSSSVSIINVSGNYLDFELNQIENNSIVIDINHFGNGVYFLIIDSENGVRTTTKFLK